MTDQERAFKQRTLAAVERKLGDGSKRPEALVTIYRATVERLTRELECPACGNVYDHRFPCV